MELKKSTITPEERTTVIQLWQETLGLATVDLDQGFADLGGTSLLANQFVSRLSRQLGVDVPVIRIFEYPTLRLLLRFLVEGPGAANINVPGPSSQANVSADDQSLRDGHDIAIVGMACRFPGANNLEQFWANLLDCRDSITQLSDAELSPEVPEELRRDPRYVRAAGLIDAPYAMDGEFFGINPMEAKLTDPQQRVLLEMSWHALEHAGEAAGRLTERAAVFAGTEDNSYYRSEIAPFPQAEKRAGRFAIMTGNEKDYVAMRIAHKLNLKGPAVSVHTACSTSLVAVIMACKSLRQRDCDLALAGGASVHFPTPEGYYFQEGGVFSPDGHCRPFDEAAQGTIFTDGAGMVVLKRVEDAVRDRNTIFAVIKGGAINSDGGEKASFSAPSVAGQANCIRAALADAGIDAGTIQYVEAHGTATPVGDPIELEGLRQAYASRRDPNRLQYCGLGSVKSNIGHTTAAAGVASLIKTALALRHNVMPATVHFKRPNPGLNLSDSPFFIVDSKLDWPRAGDPRRAGISSFGIGGTNTHVVLEEAPAVVTPAQTQERPFEIWPVSAKSGPQRDHLVAALSQERYWPRDVAYTLQTGRARFRHRGARVRLTQLPHDDLLVQPAVQAMEAPELVFMFPGQGSQYIEMGKSLAAQLPEFDATFTRCCEVLSKDMGLDFKAFIFDAANQEALENTRYTQPALFAIEVSLGRMLIDWGIEPAQMLGHSVGEFAAACLADVLSLEDALKLIAARGKLMASLPRGRMLSARGALDAVMAAAGENVDIASVNGPVHCVLAGDVEKIERIQSRLEAAAIPCRLLHTSHAFHSDMMTPVVEPFLEVVRSVTLHAPTRRIISTVTGEPMTERQATDPLYWANHLRATVQFSPALFHSIALGGNVFLEVGPRTTLSSLAAQHFAKVSGQTNKHVAIAMLGDQADPLTELGTVGAALAKLWCAGIELPFGRIWEAGRRVPLVSTYPFERKDFRFSEGRLREQPMATSQSDEYAEQSPTSVVPSVEEPGGTTQSLEHSLASELAGLFGDYSGLSVARLDATFVECGFDSLVLMQIGIELGKIYGVSIALRDLMERKNTLVLLAQHIAALASPDRLAHLTTKAAPIAQAAATRASAALPQSVSAHTPSTAVAGSASLALGDAYRQQLLAMRDLIELQLKQLGWQGAFDSNPGMAQRARATPDSDTGSVRPDRGEALIRRRHVDPPQPNAFRSPVDEDTEKWFVFNSSTRCYEGVRS